MTPSPLQDPSGQLCSGPSGCCLSYPGIGGQFPGEMREAFPQNSPVLLPPLPLRAGARNKLPRGLRAPLGPLRGAGGLPQLFLRAGQTVLSLNPAVAQLETAPSLLLCTVPCLPVE